MEIHVIECAPIDFPVKLKEWEEETLKELHKRPSTVYVWMQITDVKMVRIQRPSLTVSHYIFYEVRFPEPER